MLKSFFYDLFVLNPVYNPHVSPALRIFERGNIVDSLHQTGPVFLEILCVKYLNTYAGVRPYDVILPEKMVF